jgi:hypothetical protein
MAIHDTAQGISKITINNFHYIKTDQWAYLSLYRKDPDGQLARIVRNANFGQMMRYALESDTVLREAQSLGKLDAAALAGSLRARRLAIDYAGMLDIEELNTLYSDLGNAVKDLFIKGNDQLIDGLLTQDPAKISQGQQGLDQWSAWFLAHKNNLQKIFE